MRVLSGIQPSGRLHIGNYFGMMKPAIELQAENECFYFIADVHALTQLPAPQALRERVLNVALGFLAWGLDPAGAVFFRRGGQVGGVGFHQEAFLRYLPDQFPKRRSSAAASRATGTRKGEQET